jgi:Zn-dependent membrane protease YugP
MIFDPIYFLFLAPGMLLAAWAQIKVKSAYAHGQKYQPRSGLSGAETAQRILNVYGINDVAIEPVQSFLGDHYDSRHKVLRLSPGVYHGRSLAALGIAAHECGHALQHAHRYGPLAIRNGIVPLANFGSNVAWLLIIGGMFTNIFGLVLAGIAAFSLVVLFQLINLPVEFNASSRARDILVNQGMVTVEEDQVVKKVLSAAAMTYVAATLTAVLTLLYFIFRAYGSRH